MKQILPEMAGKQANNCLVSQQQINGVIKVKSFSNYFSPQEAYRRRKLVVDDKRPGESLVFVNLNPTLKTIYTFS